MGFLRNLIDSFRSPTPYAASAEGRAQLQELQRQVGGVIDGDRLFIGRREADYVDGRHYTEHVDTISSMLRAGEYEAAESLLLRICDAMEGGAPKVPVAPWYYERLAIMYRKLNRSADEIAILERYDAQLKAPGAKPGKLKERLSKVRAKRPDLR